MNFRTAVPFNLSTQRKGALITRLHSVSVLLQTLKKTQRQSFHNKTDLIVCLFDSNRTYIYGRSQNGMCDHLTVVPDRHRHVVDANWSLFGLGLGKDHVFCVRISGLFRLC